MDNNASAQWLAGSSTADKSAFDRPIHPGEGSKTNSENRLQAGFRSFFSLSFG